MANLFPILLLFLLVYPNARLAKKKGQNPYLWGFLSIVGFFAVYTILGGIYLPFVFKGPLNREAIETWAKNSPLQVLTLMLFGVGGVLLVRFILERRKNS